LRGGNVLVLDEPTNDLDLQTLRVLEDAVLAFEGCALLVSHDRYFLNRLCTHLIVFEAGGNVVQIAGNYDDYLAWREERDSENPSPQKERKETQRRKDGAAKRKLSYREQRDLDGIEDAIHAAEANCARLESLANDPATYQKGREEAARIATELSAARAEADRLYARWAELDAMQA